MRKGLVLSNSWEHIGALLANEEDTEQIKFFKAFLKEMSSWDTSFARDMQLTYIGKGLTDEEKELFKHFTYKEQP